MGFPVMKQRVQRTVSVFSQWLAASFLISEDVSRQFCGEVASPNRQHQALFVLVGADKPVDERVRIFLCDFSSNCDVVFVGPSDPPPAIAWRGDAELLIRAQTGSLVQSGAVASTGSGRPPAKPKQEKENSPISVSTGGWHSFSEQRCGRPPPLLRVGNKTD